MVVFLWKWLLIAVVVAIGRSIEKKIFVGLFCLFVYLCISFFFCFFLFLSFFLSLSFISECGC